MIGTKLAHYEITGHLGTGGMGEVYQATDSKLGRSVAIKLLPEAFTNDGERSARFEREARVLASLNHPNIAAIYGVEESGGRKFLVMELVPGETLAERISRGAIPMDDTLRIASQIMEALEAAHEKGVVHRDLKPANIKITADGRVKVLDFGLAKAFEPETGNASLSNSPTMSIAATQQGVILGTASYMSPEQARGRPVDQRADIWAFGCVLYELLSGKRTFDGETVVDIIGAVVNREPDWSALPQGSPVRTLKRCLEKDPKHRLRSIGDAVLEPESAVDAAIVPRSVWRHPLVRALAFVASAAAVFAFWNSAGSVPKPVIRLSIALPPGQEITDYPAISPDGQTIAYAARQGTQEAQLYIRKLNSFESQVVIGSSGTGQRPFFRPDGKWVAFFADGYLKKVEVAGGSPVKIAVAPLPFGGSWGDDDTIVFVPTLNGGLVQVSAIGGKTESLTMPDGAGNGYAHVFPQWLPGGRKVFFSIWGKNSGAAVLSLDSKVWQRLEPKGGVTYSSATFAAGVGSLGTLLNVDESAGIRAARMDASKAQPVNTQTSVLNNVYFNEEDLRPYLATSKNGTLVYVPGNPAKRSLAWVDHDGRVTPIGTKEDVYSEAALSPDGLKAVVRHLSDLWIHDLQGANGTRPLTDAGSNFRPVWRDNNTVLFGSSRTGDWDIYYQPADGSGPAEPLLKRPNPQFPLSIGLDGTLLFLESQPTTSADLWVFSPDGKTSKVRGASFDKIDADFSPKGDWIAFESNENGQSEIYVQRYPGGGNRKQVSNEGGEAPRWSHNGKELFYLTGDAMVALAVGSDGSISTTPRRLFDRSGFYISRFHSYDVSPDGKRFLMIRRDPESAPRQLNVILNWSEELEKLVPPLGK
jgi:serine/threonine protein kinase/Tol biopolymer transport system component